MFLQHLNGFIRRYDAMCLSQGEMSTWFCLNLNTLNEKSINSNKNETHEIARPNIWLIIFRNALM